MNDTCDALRRLGDFRERFRAHLDEHSTFGDDARDASGKPLAFGYNDPALLSDFRTALMEEDWLRPPYDLGIRAYIDHPDRIDTADLEALRQILVFTDRGERFADGWWHTVVEDGVLDRVLQRVQAIYAERCA